ncbi:hypothetical protein P152DRAFT_176569 [Eremomyces bilateralis CBS 781.70]|uniref:Zn(2)-C6 fungal-type domain-containing protein n=1 Tax=Eremomyces bilateralis CBS 781.70 TaxID=1392243 RepID=A0A6G1FT64_9PEZI|nr:uncharacterized protein P152DRAFT_176569 [Eremomyces bilateralis CBS 781.70]KAF1808926.1 hypothetical protein P152DRAFT_176569 [Eremomyces bilateralis CBS 781.70]
MPPARTGRRRNRKLEYLKCRHCRRDKQKCLPTERRPGQKCGRCQQKGFPCSENETSRTPQSSSSSSASLEEVQMMVEHLNYAHILRSTIHKTKKRISTPRNISKHRHNCRG